ncbi:MAG TPA: cytochrome c-type biogenesis protein [Gaiellaceae bacterium]|nr:cytochrome c-type biogenesis protein [Gaiellaceae bacterium]
MRRGLLLGLLAVCLTAGAAGASEQKPTLAELEKELICPTCQTTLELSNSPVAERMRVFIRQRIAAGDTKSEIKDALVAQFGEAVLAAPPKSGFNLLAWLLPLAGGAVAIGAVAVALRRWSRTRAETPVEPPSGNGRAPLDPELERRLDDELARFDA